jgi:hypothetical protein
MKTFPFFLSLLVGASFVIPVVANADYLIPVESVENLKSAKKAPDTLTTADTSVRPVDHAGVFSIENEGKTVLSKTPAKPQSDDLLKVTADKAISTTGATAIFEQKPVSQIATAKKSTSKKTAAKSKQKEFIEETSLNGHSVPLQAASNEVQPVKYFTPPVQERPASIDSGNSIIVQPTNSFVPAQQMASVLYVKEGTTEIIKIAKGTLNRIVLPFAKPRTLTINAALSNCDEGIKGSSVLCVDQGAMFVATNEDAPINLFITDAGSQRAISIALQPAQIPPRDVKLILSDDGDDSQATSKIAGGDESRAEHFEKGQPYLDTLTKMLRDIAQGQIPPGYSLSEVKDANNVGCQISGMRTRLAQVMEGALYKVNVYVVDNVTGTQMLVNEQSCYARGVVAAAAWPRVVLEANESTEIYVVVRRDSTGDSSGFATRPVLVTY